MKGLALKLSPNNRDVYVKLEPLLLETAVEAITISQAFNKSELADFYLEENAVFTAVDSLKSALINNQMDPIEVVIAQAKDAEIEVTISGDKMIAEITITSPYRGNIPSTEDIFTILGSHEVVRGISKKRIQQLINSAAVEKGGRHVTGLVAKGLPPRMGKDSYIKELVPNALDRMLTPKLTDDEKVNMRDFGEIICVKPYQAIAQRMPPTSGRTGFTVFGSELASEAGKWKKIILGEHVYVENSDENIVLAKVEGLPKIARNKVFVDNVLVTRGVNISTGNINFEGSIIVNGDITEKMKVIAKGDVTVNGFIESAHIEAGGNIIVTQGASGKLQTLDCNFIAGGSIYIGHAQGVNIKANNDLVIDKQLAYSKVNCKGNITVGKIDKPLGKLFASSLVCTKTVRAGNIGAVSGSSLVINYSDSFEQLIETHDRLMAQFQTLSKTNADHEIKIANIKNRKPSAELTEKLSLIYQELELERVFLNWLRINVEESKEQIRNFTDEARVIANKALHNGVTIKLGKKIWQAKKDFERCHIVIRKRNWVHEPLT